MENEESYWQLIARAKAIQAKINEDQWRMAALACSVEDKYGKKSLAQFAVETGVSLREIKKLRDTGRAWPQDIQAYYDEYMKDMRQQGR